MPVLVLTKNRCFCLYVWLSERLYYMYIYDDKPTSHSSHSSMTVELNCSQNLLLFCFTKVPAFVFLYSVMIQLFYLVCLKVKTFGRTPGSSRSSSSMVEFSTTSSGRTWVRGVVFVLLRYRSLVLAPCGKRSLSLLWPFLVFGLIQ